MFTKFAAVAAPVFAAAMTAIAAPALASTQLERILNVEPGAYTTSQLIRLDQAIQDNDDFLERQIRANPQGFAGAGEASDQLARLHGVEGRGFSAAQVILLDQAESEFDEFLVMQRRANPTGAASGDGDVQFVALPGYGEGYLTTAERIFLDRAVTENDDARIRGIFSRANSRG